MMRAKASPPLPLARTDQLIIQELPDEVLVYDLKRDRAHCLNRTAAQVWKHCDARTSVAELTRLLEKEYATPISDDVVWLALGQLRKFHLLEKVEGQPMRLAQVSRRDLLQKYVPAALALPLIMSIAAPAAAQAGSRCAQLGQSCEFVPCCPNLNCDGICFPA